MKKATAKGKMRWCMVPSWWQSPPLVPTAAMYSLPSSGSVDTQLKTATLAFVTWRCSQYQLMSTVPIALLNERVSVVFTRVPWRYQLLSMPALPSTRPNMASAG